MPDRNYTIKYDASSAGKAASDIDKLLNKVIELDAAVQKLGPKLRLLGKQVSKNAAEGATGVNKLTAACANLSPVANTAAANLKSIGTAARSTNKSLNMTVTTGNAVTASIMGISAAGIGMRVVREVAKGLADAFDEARKFAEETAEKTIKLKDAVRELKAVSGDQASLEGVTDEVKKVMLSAGMTQQEAIAYSVMIPQRSICWS